MANTLDLSGLTAYVKENTDLLVSKIASVTDSSKYMQIQDGITADEHIHGLITNLTIQDGASCGFNATAGQSITERTLPANFLKVNHQYCAKDFYKTYMAYQTKVAMGKSNLPLEEALIEDVIKAIAVENETLLWSGSKASGDLVDGLTTIIAADSNIPAANKFTSTKTTVLERVMEAYEKINMKNLSLAVSMPMYRELVMDLVNKNLFVYHEDENAEHIFTIPATSVKVYGIEGIADTDTNIYGLNWNEIFMGCDTAEDASKFDFFWSEDDRVYKLDIEWVLSTNYMFSDHIYVYSK